MYSSFLNIPVNFKEIKQKDEVQRVSVINSLHNLIHLIVTTEYGEMRHNPSFGCDIWKFDFENIYNLSSFKEELKKLYYEQSKSLEDIAKKIWVFKSVYFKDNEKIWT